MLPKSAVILRREIVYVLLTATALLGCTGDLPDGAGTPTVPLQATSIELPQGVYQQLTPNERTFFAGELVDPATIDVWDFGAAEAGTKIVVDVAGEGNLSCGLFDGEQVLLISNDRYLSKDPYGVVTLTEDVAVLKLAIASDLLEASRGRYWVTVTHREPNSAEPKQTQYVVLNFGGADHVAIGNMAPVNVPPFRAADLEPAWVGLDQEMKQIVMERVKGMYEGLNVAFHFDDDPHLPSNQALTWVHFGGSDVRNVGLADRVDYGNQYKQEKAIIYTGNFAKYVAAGYDHRGLAQGFANVAAHELGHLLGLNHSDEPADVMNVSPTVAALMAPQYFVETAGLDPSVFRAGFQDGAQRVYYTVGGSWPTVEQSRAESAVIYDAYAQAVPLRLAAGADAAVGSYRLLSSTQHCDCGPARLVAALPNSVVGD